MNSVTNAVVMDVLCNFFLICFVDENKRVMFGISCVIFYSISARVVSVLFLAVCD